MSWAYEPGAREAATLADMLAIPAHRCMHTVAPWRQTRCGPSARSCAFCLLSCGVFLSLLRQMATMDTLAALGWSICATYWCGCSITGQGAGTAGSSASKSGENENCPIALLSHGYLPYRLQRGICSDSKLLETSRGLGTGGPAAREIAASTARERGRK